MSPTVVEGLLKPSFRKDCGSIIQLFLLYFYQGILFGVFLTVPFLLQSQGVPYKDQAVFSFASLPISVKVLYAPIIDVVYWKRLGRRKSWVVPTQYLISIFLFVLAWNIDDMFESSNMIGITSMFFVLKFLIASQDVAVDGWALTMLSPENVGYAATCQSLGKILGTVLTYSGFLAFESKSFANKFRTIPQEYGFVTFPQLLVFCGVIFFISTTLILIFKKEKKETSEVDEQHMDLSASYLNLWKILQLKNMRIFILILLTVHIGTAATESMTKLKLVENGIPRETLAFFSIPLIPLNILLPIVLAKWTVGPSPMSLYINMIPLVFLFAIINPLVVYWIPAWQSENGDYPSSVYFFLFGLAALELIPNFACSLTEVGFSARISDPAIGGTYMTLIMTIMNLGGRWTNSLALWLVETVAIPLDGCSEMLEVEFGQAEIENGTAPNEFAQNVVLNNTESNINACTSRIDGYYVESMFCVIAGIVWLLWARPTIMRLQRKPKSSWKIL